MIPSRRWTWATWPLLVAACHADLPTSSPPPPPVATTISVISGDGQVADPEDSLADPVRFLVADATGRPMRGVTLQFNVPVGGGSVPSPTATTDSNGVAGTPWVMGPFGGVQMLEARASDSLVATATAQTCDPSECYLPSRLSATLSDATLLSLTTYESSGQAMHPDIVRGHRAVTGFWLAVTPYPGGDALFENPSIFRSRDASSWTIPLGATNPLVSPASPTYLSDPDLAVDSARNLWMFYREVNNTDNIIKVIRSADGAHWSSPVTVITVPTHEVVSPTVVRGAPDAPWQMWSVNSGPRGCGAPQTTVERRTSEDGLHWGGATTVNLVQPGQLIWHIDVEWIPARSEYWALYNTYPSGTICTTDALYLATSPDGVNWTVYPSPIARVGVINAFRAMIYRATFMTNPKATQVTLWMSGAEYVNNAYVWHTATVSTTVSGLFNIASQPAQLVRAVPLPGRLPPPEPDVGSGNP